MAEVGRQARLVLLRDDEVLGALPPFPLAMPWWPEAHDVVAAAHERFGIDVTVLRLLETRSENPFGGSVTYLAETAQPPRRPGVALEAWPAEALEDEPLRQPWARPGGPAALLRWAEEQLASHGIRLTAPPEQVRTWNLSAIWRLPTTVGRVWLKAVPPFFAHEGDVIDWIGPPTAPRLFGHMRGRVLMAEIPGRDNHETRGPTLRPMVDILTRLQEHCIGRTDELLDLGVPDRRLPRMLPRVERVAEERAGVLDRSDRRTVEHLVAALPQRIAAIEACGVPDTLVHGDFHPGNVVGDEDGYVVLDWGDCFVGHPMVDELAFTRRLDGEDLTAARLWFVDAWRRVVPGADPARAAELLRPVLPLLAAVMYADFCAAIEPSERVYHESDVALMLQQAAVEARLP